MGHDSYSVNRIIVVAPVNVGAMGDSNDRLRLAREASGFGSMAAAADSYGWNPSTYRSHENGQTDPVPLEDAERYAAAFKVSAAWILTGEGQGPKGSAIKTAARAASPPIKRIPYDTIMATSLDFPVYASAEGGPGEIIRSSEPIDFKPRPAPVQHVKDAYGLIVTGTSMEPEFWPGDTMLINPRLPIIGGKAYVFYSEIDGEARATVKHLRKANGESWFVSQWNPKKDFALKRKEWGICHRVLGKYD